MSKLHTEKKKVNRRTPEQKAAVRKLTSRIFLGVTAALMLVFIVFIFVTTNFMGSDGIVTEVTYKDYAYDTISTTGFVIRNEECLKKNTNGVLVYQVENGEKVTANGTIATVYAEETDAVNYQRIRDIDNEISELQQLNEVLGSSNVGLDSVNNRLDQRLTDFIEYVNKRDFSDISTAESELLSAIYRKQMMTGDQKNFDEKIKELEEEKATLESSFNESIDTIKTKSSGYFVSDIDGYENTFSVDDLSQVKYSDISNAKPKEVSEDEYIGKIIKGVNWYIACPITEEEAVAINHNSGDITISIPYATSETMPVKVVCVNQFSNEEKAVAILECNYMNSALTQIRNEAVDINLSTYEGLKISKKALHDDYITSTVTDEDGNTTEKEIKVQGVYVKYGNQLIFKQVFIIYSGEDYVICSDDPGQDVLVNGTTLELYDEVVVEGDDLYNGKIID